MNHALTYPSSFFEKCLAVDQSITRFFSKARQIVASFITSDDVEDTEVLPEADIARPTREDIEARSKSTMDRMFSDDEGEDVTPSGKPPEKKPEKKEPEKKEPKPKKEESEDDDLLDDEDYEGGLDESEEAEETKETEDDEEAETTEESEEAEEEEDDHSSGRESRAQAEAKKNGKLLKAEKARAAQLLLDKKKSDDELADARARLEEFNKLTIDPRSTPEYLELNEQMWKDVDTAVAEELPSSAAKLSDHFAGYLKAYLASTRLGTSERTAAVSELKARIVSDMGGFSDPYSELLDDERVAADTLAREVLSVVRRNAPRAEDMIKLESKLREKAKAGRLVQGAREYDRSYSALTPVLDGLGNLPDNLVEENPYSPEAVLTQLVKHNEKLDKKLKKSKADVLEIIMGPKPITDKEYETLEEQGVDIKEFLQTKEKAFAAKRAKLLPVIVKALAVLPFANKAMEALAREQREESEKRDELETLGSIESKRKAPVPAAKKKVEAKGRAADRPSAISQYLGGGFDD